MTKEELFNQNIRLAYYIAIKYKTNHQDELEDIKQVALMGLWKAILKYDGRTKISTFACICIQNEINHYLRSVKRNDMDHLEQIFYNNLTLGDTIQDDINQIENLEQKLDDEIAKGYLTKNVAKLSQRDQEIYNCLMRGESQQKVGARFGVKQSNVSKIKNKILIMAKQEMVACEN